MPELSKDRHEGMTKVESIKTFAKASVIIVAIIVGLIGILINWAEWEYRESRAKVKRKERPL